MSIMDKLKKNSRIKETQVLSESKFFNKKDMIPTQVPMINVALSGRLDGGLTPGLTVLAGPSKHFKTSFALLMAAAYLDRYSDAVMLFYDSEFGSPQSYFKNFGIDTSRVLHTPIKNIEELKFDVTNQLQEIQAGEKVIIIIDSIGNLASKKEVEDALDQKSVADMTRAKQLKSLFRIVTPYLTFNDIPMLTINHTYDEMGLFPKKVISGGTGVMYSCDNAWIIGRQQQKQGTDVIGYNFVINIEKSRFVREKSKIPISVTWEGGVEKYSGLLEVAVAGGFLDRGKKGNRVGYSFINQETGEVDEKNYYEKDTFNEEFWSPLLSNPAFAEFVYNTYSFEGKGTVDMDQIVKNEGE